MVAGNTIRLRGHSMNGIGSARPVFLTALLATTALTTVAYAADNSGAIETVVVTAEKRTEDVQRVPMSIQVLGTQKLEQLHVQSFTDYAALLPSVSFSPNAAGGGLSDPGFANVYFRGVTSGNDGNHSGSLPSVGIYLDEQPITTIGGALDIHVYDIARVEALAGPQGTLYGASSEAGTIRVITNKPDASAFSAAYDVEANDVDHGGVGASAEGFVNIPLSDHAAIRIVGWDEHDAGYIDNVAGTDLAAGIVDGVRTYPVGNISMSNAPFRKNDFNYTDITGGRAALQIELNNNWTITPSFMGQLTRAHGSYSYDPTVGDLEVVKFGNDYSNDSWYQAAATIEGKLGNLDLTYAGAYMDRHVHSLLEYSDYSFFYDTYYGQYITDNAGNVINPSQSITGKDHFTKNSQELRITSPGTDRFRYVAGLFYEQQSHAIYQQYTIADLANDLWVPGFPDTLWLTKEQRVDTDYAVFGEASLDLLSNVTLTAGGRLFESDNSLRGYFGFSKQFDIDEGSSSGMISCPDPDASQICQNLHKKTDAHGFTHKVNLTWRVDDDRMVYFTWSTGFRPGGVNRNSLVTDQPYQPDFLTNYEVGWKTSWADDTVQFNGALFLENWKNFQFSFLGPNSLTVIANAGEAQIKGIETQAYWRVTPQLTLNGSATYLDAELTQPYCKNPNDCPGTLQAPKGQQLPISPKFKGNMTARYAFEAWGFPSYVQGTVLYNGPSWNDLRTIERNILGENPAYTVANFSAGIAKDNWTVDLSLENAFDERAQLYRYAQCTPGVCGPETYIIPNRPRTIALKFGQKF
jgi:outer membrane receptor protein involved in Fe transport